MHVRTDDQLLMYSKIKGCVILALKSDFQDTLEFFIFTNLPTLMNPTNAMNIVIAPEIFPTLPTTPTSATPTTATAPVIVIAPDILKALQAYILNNFPDIGLPKDIQQVAKQFIVNLPPLIPITSATSTTSTPATTVTPTTS